MHAQLLSHVRLFVTLWSVAHQAALSMGFFRQEYWSGLTFLSPGDLSNPGIEPASPVFPALQVYALPTELLGKLIRHQDKNLPTGTYVTTLLIRATQWRSASWALDVFLSVSWTLQICMFQSISKIFKMKIILKLCKCLAWGKYKSVWYMSAVQ